ncbi:GNAT family N-acetyltransferase [Altererythrobacter soli]|uniref:GNAT family N-acetyltransferase n=1 Tax=Croceibacterium soli TaxID=1739690 RepID=A0A6I4UT03_9SPHN|nr:GNAT family N-acetyltransferase [Croceibacterium soli]MXP40894.1 GNAT family N-acetyltransferase [Croceibacterium soli]
MSEALDRPVWNSLTGLQAGLAIASGAAVRIDPGFGPFAAARDREEDAQTALAALVRAPGDEIWLVEAEEWPAPSGLTVLRTAPLLQMVFEGVPADCPEDGRIELLGESDAAAMYALAHATRPGPWSTTTHRYGPFYGVKRDGRLLAMAGERTRPAKGLAEVSGVCTDPAARGEGLATLLMRRVMADFAARGDRPFLHTYADNAEAIALYETLGYRARREMVVTVLGRAE